MSLLRLLNLQRIAGIAVSLALAILLVVQKGETRHWKKQSGHFEQLYRGEQSAFAATVASYRAAAEAARADDLANAQRVAAEQRAINDRSTNELENRLADARARADRLRVKSAAATADPGRRANAPVPGLSPAASGADQAANQDGLPPAPSTELGTGDALTATEQAIQLDELIKWVTAQAKVDNSVPAEASPAADIGHRRMEER